MIKETALFLIVPKICIFLDNDNKFTITEELTVLSSLHWLIVNDSIYLNLNINV